VSTAAGGGIEGALKRVFWKNRERIGRQLRYWTPAAIAEALRRLNEAEAKCKSTGMTDLALASHTLAALASAAQSLQRRQRERDSR
jgi:DNA polymerase-3 subunit delta